MSAGFRIATCKFRCGHRAKETANLGNNDSIKTNPGYGMRERPAERCGIAQGRPVLALVRRVQRRLFYNELFAQGANALSAALAAFILLLLIGAEVLNCAGWPCSPRPRPWPAS